MGIDVKQSSTFCQIIGPLLMADSRFADITGNSTDAPHL